MPFKYRITAVIFALAAIILAVVLYQSLNQYFKGSHEQLVINQQATLNLLGEFSRIALLTTDYENFQPQLENVASLPGVSDILLADDMQRIVVTSNPAWIGQSFTSKQISVETGWVILPLENISGTLGVLAAQFSDDSLLQLHKQIAATALIWSLFGLIIIAMISLLAGHLLTRRLAFVTRAAEAVANGDLSARAAVQGRDEVAELSHVFDNMVEKINLDRIQLEEREQYLSLTLDSIGDAVITTDAEGCVTRMNPVAEELTAWKTSEAHGHPLLDVFKIINAQSREPVSNPVEKVLASRKIVGLANHTVLISKNNTEYQIADSAAPIIDKTGKVLGVILVFRDVTQQYQVEEALRRSQKMDAIGQLSGGIAHDFNNQLSVIIGYLDFLNSEFSETDKPYKWVQTATKATLRCIDLTSQLLSFSRRQAVDKSIIDLNTVFEELQSMIARSVTAEIDVQYFLAENLWLAETNVGEFQDSIINLVINARDAMPHGGKIVIETRNKFIDNDLIDAHSVVKRGEYIEIIVSDTGTGMDKDILERIFEPFYTTKPDGKGTGLGMAMVYGFIKRYEGYINIYSEPALGTTMRIYLPRSNETEVVTENNSHEKKLPTGTESVLIVDDELELLNLANLFLTELGYRTQLAGNGVKALEILKSDTTIDLLFSDVVMPGGINGYDLARQATQLKPQLKVLLTSGFTSRSMVKDEQSIFAERLLAKPYRKVDLAQRIRQVLDEKSDN